MPRSIELTEAETEFVNEMSRDGISDPGWHNFDPDFRQKDIARLLRRGWFERMTDLGGYRQYRWTPEGRKALAQAQGHPASSGEG